MELNLLQFTSMEFNLLPFTSMEVAMEVASFISCIYFHERLHLLPSTSMEASTNFHGSWSRSASIQVTPASMETTNYFHALPSTFMEVGSRSTSMEVAPA